MLWMRILENVSYWERTDLLHHNYFVWADIHNAGWNRTESQWGMVMSPTLDLIIQRFGYGDYAVPPYL